MLVEEKNICICKHLLTHSHITDDIFSNHKIKIVPFTTPSYFSQDKRWLCFVWMQECESFLAWKQICLTIEEGGWGGAVQIGTRLIQTEQIFQAPTDLFFKKVYSKCMFLAGQWEDILQSILHEINFLICMQIMSVIMDHSELIWA